MTNPTPLALVALIVSLSAATRPSFVTAGELSDLEHGFSLVVPSDFKPHSFSEYSETAIHSFIIGNKNENTLGTIFTIERLPWTFPPGQRMDPTDLEQRKNAKVAIESIQWQGVTLDLVRHEVSNPGSMVFVNYSVQIPVSPNAIQLNVGADLKNDELARKHIEAILKSFQTDALAEDHMEITVHTQPASRLSSFIGAVTVAALVGLVIVFLLSKSKTKDEESMD
ncbi:MAG: hypothetical protein AAGA96_00770 [Verrucomicrobiota bacterium]